MIQVNGKVRDTIEVPVDVSEVEAKEIALKSEKVRNFLGEVQPKKAIYVPKRLINVVL